MENDCYVIYTWADLSVLMIALSPRENVGRFIDIECSLFELLQSYLLLVARYQFVLEHLCDWIHSAIQCFFLM